MYKAVSILFLILWSTTSNAQLELNRPYKVYLIDNSVLRGELLIDHDDYIELRLLDGKIVQVPSNDIVDYVMFKVPFPEISNYDHFNDFPNGTSYRVAGSYIIMQFGFVPDRTSKNVDKTVGFKPTFTVINGYKFKNGYAFGAGINFDVYNKSFIPIFIDFRKYFTSKRATVFLSANLGHGFAFNQFTGRESQITKGGYMVQGGGGVIMATTKNVNLLLEINFRSQDFKDNLPSRLPFSEGISLWEHWVFQMGFIF